MPRKEKRADELQKESEKDDFWNNPDSAQNTLKELESLRKEIEDVHSLRQEIKSLEEISALAQNDKEAQKEISDNLEAIETKIKKLEFQSLFSGEHDDRNAIISIHSGTGGVDAQDWAQMLLRMYLRFAERKRWQAKIISEIYGQEAGIKSAILEIIGRYAYGHFKAEAGIHRLVRLSPFNADNLRQTSFALVEVLPEIDKIKEIEIKESDIKIDTFRSGGAGGQHVNKTSSAVRVTHLLTGITAVCQSERSQLQNKEKALKILRARLFQRYLETQEKEKEKMKGKHAAVQWGSQIRSYVLHPYKLVKDHRTKYESKNPQEVLDGNLDGFIEAYLKQK